MKFVPLFRLRLAHPYYSDGRCADFSIVPTSATQGLLRNHRAVLKETADGIRVLAPLDDAGQSLIPLAQDAVFVFHLRLKNPDFTLFTDLADMAGLNAPLYTNATPGFSDDMPLPLVAGTAPRHQDFAAVEIHHSDILASEFHIGFKAKQIRWKYYCITDPGEIGDELRIVDADAGLVFGDGNRTDLSANPDPGDAVAAHLAKQYPELRRTRFVSDQPVDCRQAARGQLALFLNTDKLISALPNPSLRNYAKVDINDGVEDSLFQVVKYFKS